MLAKRKATLNSKTRSFKPYLFPCKTLTLWVTSRLGGTWGNTLNVPQESGLRGFGAGCRVCLMNQTPCLGN